ncbi:phytoene desaturase family protein [Bacillus sp. N1-1]|jgi:phytoene desaturase|uniref:phytoene desaturase family protein n=1 Tax=Bacillus sp. N1-1 TaxID=2682541 RepID=UPI0013188402|nr:phytoene desaturase family protein [Bacillus sp. N1-1]QHA91961.1 phytoene desaturase [Bacillus sp. N1-1]
MTIGIVGGGIGGMLSALLLSQKGYKVEIHEKASSLGGRLAFIEKDGFKIDKGPTIVLLPEMIYEFLDKAGIPREEVEMVRCDPLYRMIYPNGETFTKTSDIDKQLKEITRMFPGEEQHFLSYIEDMRERFIKGKAAFLEQSFVKRTDFFTPSNIKLLLELKAYQSVQSQVSDYFTDERLQDAFSLQTLYIGGSPSASPALYSLVPFSEYEHGIWYIKGGYASLITVLEKHLNIQNIPVHLESSVEELLIEGHVCKGIRTSSGEHYYDKVVYNGDFPMIKHLIKDVKAPRKKYKASSGCLLLYMGLDRVYENADVHQFFMTDNFSSHMKDVFQSGKLTDQPAIYTFHPSRIDETLAPPGKGVLYVLIPVPSGESIQWDEKEHVASRMIELLESRGFPGLREAIEWMEIRTPADAEVEGLYKGGSFGIAPTLTQSGAFRPQVKPFKYDNLYAVGASIHPGGGIPIVMQGADLLVKEIERV